MFILFAACPARELATTILEEGLLKSYENNAELFITFIIMSLFFMIIGFYLTLKFKVHFNLPLWIVGLLIGGFYQNLSIFGGSFDYMRGVVLRTIILVYVPAIGFSSAFFGNNYVLYTRKWQIFLLMMFGVSFSTVLIGFGVRFLTPMGQDITIIEAMIIGTIMCCVEPGAFMGRLHALGIPKRMFWLIQGESGVTPGFSIILMVLSLNIHESDQFDFSKILRNFLFNISGLTASALTFAVLVSPFLIGSRRFMVSMLITMFASVSLVIYCFGDFLNLKFSSLVATFVFGQTLGYLSKEHMDQKIISNMEVIWDFIKTFADATIILIAGAYIGGLYWTDVGQEYISNYIWQTPLVFLIVLASRGIKLCILAPFLNLIGEKIKLKDILLLTLVGINGTISVTLAMDIGMRRVSTASPHFLSIFLGSTCLTIFLQVVFISVVNYVGMVNYPQFKLDIAKFEIQQKTLEKLSSIKNELKLIELNKDSINSKLMGLSSIIEIREDILRVVRSIYRIRNNFDLTKLDTSKQRGSENVYKIQKRNTEDQIILLKNMTDLHGIQGVVTKDGISNFCKKLEGKPEKGHPALLDYIGDLNNVANKSNEAKICLETKNRNDPKEMMTFKEKELEEKFDNLMIDNFIEINGINGRRSHAQTKDSIDWLKKHDIKNVKSSIIYPARNLENNDNPVITDILKNIQTNSDMRVLKEDAQKKNADSHFTSKSAKYSDFYIENYVKKYEDDFRVDIQYKTYSFLKKELKASYQAACCHLRTFNYGIILFDLCLDYFGETRSIVRLHSEIYKTTLRNLLQKMNNFPILKSFTENKVFTNMFFEYEILDETRKILEKLIKNIDSVFQIFSDSQRILIYKDLCTEKNEISEYLEKYLLYKNLQVFSAAREIFNTYTYPMHNWYSELFSHGDISERTYLKMTDKLESNQKKILKYFSDFVNQRQNYSPVQSPRRSSVVSKFLYDFPFLTEVRPETLSKIVDTSAKMSVARKQKIVIFENCPQKIYLLKKGRFFINNNSDSSTTIIDSFGEQLMIEPFFLRNLFMSFTIDSLDECVFISLEIDIFWSLVDESDEFLQNFLVKVVDFLAKYSSFLNIRGFLWDIFEKVLNAKETKYLSDFFSKFKFNRVFKEDSRAVIPYNYEIELSLSEEASSIVSADEKVYHQAEFRQQLGIHIYDKHVYLCIELKI
jgi:hypothetical protein